jgi:hypothetical protein
VRVCLILCDLEISKQCDPGPSWATEPQKKNTGVCKDWMIKELLAFERYFSFTDI